MEETPKRDEGVPFKAETQKPVLLPETIQETESGMIGPLAEVYAFNHVLNATQSPSPRMRRRAYFFLAIFAAPIAFGFVLSLLDVIF